MNRGEAAFGQHHDLKLAEGDNALGVGWYGCYRRDVTDITNAVLKALKPGSPDTTPASANGDEKVKALEKELADLKAKQAAQNSAGPSTANAPAPTKPPTTPTNPAPCKSVMTDANGKTTCLDSNN